jgi:pyridoxine 5-phosphate synthase
MPILLGVNIDHVATIRNARGTNYPNPVKAALIAEQAGADYITVHLREDRRHITDQDIRNLQDAIQTYMNLEIAINKEIIDFACKVKPRCCCLVPENRLEITTEGGLDIVGHRKEVNSAVDRLHSEGIIVSLFIDPVYEQIIAAAESKASYIEIHTGGYANSSNELEDEIEIKRISEASTTASELGLKVNAGHGLNYHNVLPIASLLEIKELNIGHAIIARAMFDGMSNAVRDMKKLIQQVR